MAFQISPGVNVSEIDLTTVIPSLSTSAGAIAGQFNWGPIEQVTTISNENSLADLFGKPTQNTFTTFFSAANFLAYSNNLKVVRASGTGSLNATSNTGVLIKNSQDFEQNRIDDTAYSFAAKYAGELGDSISVSICPNANAFSKNVSAVTAVVTQDVVASNTSIVVPAAALSYLTVGDLIALEKGTTITDYVEVTNINVTTNVVTVATEFGVAVGTNSYLNRRWKYYSQFSDAPATSSYVSARGGSGDELHIVVVDAGGEFTGIKGNVLEKFGFVSKASDAKNSDGTTNYFKSVLNNRSRYIWSADKPDIGGATWGNAASGTTFTDSSNNNEYTTLAGGANGTFAAGEILVAYDLFSNPDTSDVSLIISGDAGAALVTGLIALAESRKDCLVFVSPEKNDAVDNYGDELRDVLLYRNTLPSSSYAVMDSAWKYQYDKYNDTYRWIPLNGDIAGLAARTDNDRDPWFSPAGLNRGVIKNVIKLSWSPDKAARDDLYLKGVNPVVTFPGEGTILYGDKTLLSRPSAFDRINVRRLFIVLEKMIAKASRSMLFEFNDQFTRAQFVAMVEPFLRDVQGRRGIYDFRVVCDDTNNTPEIIDRNEFVGDIYIKPTRSINYIQLNFVAVRTGVAFEEIVGRY